MKKIIILLSTFVSLAACHKKDSPVYSGKEYVQFIDKNANMYRQLDKVFSFCYSGSEAIVDTVFLDVIIAGGTSARDRKIALKQVREYRFEYEYDEDGIQVDSTLVEVGNQAVAGVHYVPFDNPYAAKLLYLEKGKVEGKIGIILKRNISLQSEDFNLNVEIVSNDDFEVGDIRSTRARVVIMDRLTRPEGWNCDTGYPGYDPNRSRFWGYYGAVKHQFMIDNSPSGERWDDAFLEELNKDEGKMLWYASFFTRKLNEVNQARALQGLAPLRENPNDPDSKVEFAV